MTSIEEIAEAWSEAHPTRPRETNAVDQTHGFLNAIKPGDQIMTPGRAGKLYVGTPLNGEDVGRFHRQPPGVAGGLHNCRRVEYRPEFILREEFPVAMRYPLMGRMPVFNINEQLRLSQKSDKEEGRGCSAPPLLSERRV